MCISLQWARLLVVSRFETQQSDNHAVVKKAKTEFVAGGPVIKI